MKQKKVTGILAPFFLLVIFAACSEDGNSWSAKDVCPEDGVSAYGMPNRGMFIDERDGQVYKYTTIGNQVWMAENLNYETDYSICYDNGDSDCNFWGRYYSLQENNDENGKLDYARVDSVCPMGWHVPSNDEWLELINVVGKLDDRETAMRLKSTNLWNEKRESGSDDCAFSSLPAGYLYWNGGITDMFLSASYWSSTMKTSSSVFDIIIHSSVLNHFADAWMTLRCIKD